MFWVGACSVSLPLCVVGWVLVFCLYTVLWVGWCAVSLLHCVVGWSVFVSVSLLHCDMGWLVFVFCVFSTLCCGLTSVMFPFTLCCELGGVLCPLFTLLWVGQCLCSVSLLHCVVSWLMFCIPSSLCCGLVSIHVLCPFDTVFLVGWSFLFCVPSTPCFVVSWPLCSLSLLHCVLG